MEGVVGEGVVVEGVVMGGVVVEGVMMGGVVVVVEEVVVVNMVPIVEDPLPTKNLVLLLLHSSSLLKFFVRVKLYQILGEFHTLY